MTIKQVDAILWRSYATSTSDALWGARSNQYYIDLPVGDYEIFFNGQAEGALDEQGNQTFSIWLSEFDGIPAEGKYCLTLKKLRKGIAREDSWNINGQHAKIAYALWQKERGPNKPFSDLSTDEKRQNFLLVVRDIENGFHGRWIQAMDFSSLPEGIKNLISAKPAGWSKL